MRKHTITRKGNRKRAFSF